MGENLVHNVAAYSKIKDNNFLNNLIFFSCFFLQIINKFNYSVISNKNKDQPEVTQQ